ncbi:hypothetical protein [Methylobacterium sp. PvR107]|uniref:hypothetical protein n=1 Tax=Methylobacterium sp. PvR107 TaxID=2806597 RepID=UPI001AE9E11D|nr:hypothetical protein [Methylobacterium sp. PvR107]MBP1180523.1 hypothetical protein [Methylobacterium sp. PvR107]
MRAAGFGLRPVLPWLVLTAGLILATLPAWRPLIFGTAPTRDDLLSLRCLSR